MYIFVLNPEIHARQVSIARNAIWKIKLEVPQNHDEVLAGAGRPKGHGYPRLNQLWMKMYECVVTIGQGEMLL